MIASMWHNFETLRWLQIARMKMEQLGHLWELIETGWWPAPRRSGPDEPQYCRRPKSWPTRTCPRFLAGN